MNFFKSIGDGIGKLASGVELETLKIRQSDIRSNFEEFKKKNALYLEQRSMN